MAKTTPAPSFDICAQFPKLAELAKTTTRLHPAPYADLPSDVSKIGGRFLWPKNEPWPECPDKRHQYATKTPRLSPVVQLFARDFPDLPFPPGCDLFQLLWCPVTEDACAELMAPAPHAFWRNSQEILEPLAYDPPVDTSEFIEDILLFQECIPAPCSVSPEKLLEYPGLYQLPDEIEEALDQDVYQGEVGPCPSSKVGGYPFWVEGSDQTPKCDCGRRMEFLLQVFDWEYTNIDDPQRWIPLEDRWAVAAYDANRWDRAALAVLQPMGFDFHHYAKYVFVCRSCDGWPVKLVEQN